jgi:hypothetical protein
MAQVTELVTKFAFTGSTIPLFQYNKGLGTAITGMAAFTAASVAAVGVAAKWSSSILQSLDPLAQLERRTGVAIGNIQELGFVATQTGSTVEAAQSTILSLTQSIADAALNGSEDFARLGISVRDANGQLKTADVVLGEVRDRFGEMSLSIGEQENLAGALGIDQTLVQMLNLSAGEMANLTARARELGVLTSEQGEQVIAYNDALNQQRFAVSSVKNLIAVGFAPTLTDLTNNFTDLIAENKDWIVNVASKTIEIGADLIDFFLNLGGAVLDFADYISMGHGEMTLFIGALAAGAAAFPVTAAIIGVTLAVEDLITAFQGGESVIADFFEENFGVDIVQKVQDFNKLIKGTADAVKFLTGSEGYEPVAIPQSVQDQFDYIPGPNGLQMVPRSSGNAQITQDVKININTNNPAAAGRAVVDNLNNQQENAINQLDTGGR